MRIWRPCDDCVHRDDCDLAKGCRQWQAYFRAYWRELRRVCMARIGCAGFSPKED